MAERVATLRDPDAPDRQAALREVVSRCIHGVDRNPMAVELAKVALWIESVTPGQPLGFLDANIRCGDALLGVFDLAALDEGVPDEAYKSLTGDSKPAAKYYAVQNKAARKGQGQFDWATGAGAMPPARLATTLSTVRRMTEDTVGQVERKRAAFAEWERGGAYGTRVACDLYVAAFLLPKTEVPENHGRHMVPTTADVRTRLAGGNVYGPLEAAAVDAPATARVFHWPLAFPDVMLARGDGIGGGFDVVLGNPPWERIKLQEQEFFAGTPAADAANAAARTRMIDALGTAEAGTPDRVLFDRFRIAKRVAEAMSLFARVPGDAGGRYRFTGTGDVNTYALFAEHFLNLTRTSGRAGIIVPTGIATDATTAPFFGHLVSEARLARLFDFENSAPLFQGVHRSFKFSLLTIGSGVQEADFAFFLTDTTQLDDARRRFTLSRYEIAAINPQTGSAPTFRSRRDAELGALIARRAPSFSVEAHVASTWSVSFHTRLWHMSEDTDLFASALDLTNLGASRVGMNWFVGSDNFTPLYESKMIDFFDHRYAGYQERGDDRGHRVLPPTSLTNHSSPHFEADPFYWVPWNEVVKRLNGVGWHHDWLIGWKEITSPTTERSLVVSVIPKVAVGHKFPLMFPLDSPARVAALYACLASLVLDFTARQRLGSTSFSLTLLRQLPVLPPSTYTEADLAFIVPRVLELSYTSHAMAPFAHDLGYDGAPFAWDEARRAELRAELDAWYALAYGLSRDELRYVLDPKDVMGADYPSETFRVLQKNEIARHGEYRTRRLVLAAYDAQVAAGGQPRVAGYR